MPGAPWRSARVAADGTLLFSSTQRLSSYDNAPTSAANCSAQPCTELYRFAPGEEALSCISCSPAAAAPSGAAKLENVGGSYAPSPRNRFLTRNLSSDGNRAFFDSPDALVPRDVNGVIDPYEWEAQGTGSCETATAGGGCIYLLSTGTNPRPSYLGDISASGDDAFFFTDQPLVPGDEDQLVDAYDARVGGGLASQHQGEGAAPCLGEACKGGSSGPPQDSAVGSSTFSGPANPAPKPAKRCKSSAKKKCKKAKKHRKSHSKKSRGAHTNRGGSK